jgi:hypothetical protein
VDGPPNYFASVVMSYANAPHPASDSPADVTLAKIMETGS